MMLVPYPRAHQVENKLIGKWQEQSAEAKGCLAAAQIITKLLLISACMGVLSLLSKPVYRNHQTSNTFNHA